MLIICPNASALLFLIQQSQRQLDRIDLNSSEWDQIIHCGTEGDGRPTNCKAESNKLIQLLTGARCIVKCGWLKGGPCMGNQNNDAL